MSTTAKPFENPVVAALETCADRRWRDAETAGVPAAPDTIGRTVAVIEAAVDKIEANDFSAIESLLVSQALALDVIFNQFVRHSAYGDRLSHSPMHMALRAQSQCRVTLKNLVALKTPRPSQNSNKRTIEPAKIPG